MICAVGNKEVEGHKSVSSPQRRPGEYVTFLFQTVKGIYMERFDTAGSLFKVQVVPED